LKKYLNLRPLHATWKVKTQTAEVYTFYCSGLSVVILVQFTVEICIAAKSHRKNTKNLFLDFKVVQGHQCWYILKARLQRLLR